MISYTDNQSSVNAGAQQLLEDMQRGVGDVISESSVLILVVSLGYCLAGLEGRSVDMCRWTCEAWGLGGKAQDRPGFSDW